MRVLCVCVFRWGSASQKLLCPIAGLLDAAAWQRALGECEGTPSAMSSGGGHDGSGAAAAATAGGSAGAERTSGRGRAASSAGVGPRGNSAEARAARAALRSAGADAAARAPRAAPSANAARAFTGASAEAEDDATRAFSGAGAGDAARAFSDARGDDDVDESVGDGVSVDAAFLAAVARGPQTVAELSARVAADAVAELTARLTAETVARQLAEAQRELAETRAKLAVAELKTRVAELELDKARASSVGDASEGGETALSSLSAATQPFFVRPLWGATLVGHDPDESGITPGERAKRIMSVEAGGVLAVRNGMIVVTTAVSLLWQLQEFAQQKGALPFDITGPSYMEPAALELARAMARESAGGAPRSTTEWVSWLQVFVSLNGYTLNEAIGLMKRFALGGVLLLSEKSIAASLAMHVSRIGKALMGVRDAEWRKLGASGQVVMAILNTLPERLQKTICDGLKISGPRSVPAGVDFVALKAAILESLTTVVQDTEDDWETRKAFCSELVLMREAAAAAVANAAAAAHARATSAAPSAGWKVAPAVKGAWTASGPKPAGAQAPATGAKAPSAAQGTPAVAATGGAGGGRSVGGASMTCYNCGAVGHMSRECQKKASSMQAAKASTAK